MKESHCQCCKDGVKPAEVMVLKVLVEVWGQLHLISQQIYSLSLVSQEMMQYLQSELAVGQRQCLEALHENFLASKGNFLYNNCFHLKKIQK